MPVVTQHSKLIEILNLPMINSSLTNLTPCTPDQAIAEFRAGRMLIITGGRHSQGDADLVIPARSAGAEEVNFMAREGRGLICLALTGKRCDELGLEPMAERRVPLDKADFTVSIEAAEGVTTGISAADRARTVAAAIDPANGSESLVRPGHVFPLRERLGGVLARAGHVEAAIDLGRMSDVGESAVLCQILDDDGEAARGQYLVDLARRHDLKVLDVDHLVEQLKAEGEEGPEDSRVTGDLRRLLGHFATGVTVITTTDREGEACGTTANAFTSVSLDPPLILVCLARGSQTLESIRDRGGFVANILADGQQEHSNWFARKGVRLKPAEHDFRRGKLDLPILDGTLAHVECEVERIDEGGDHEIILGRVVSSGHHESAPDPLLFFRGGYRSLGLPPHPNHI